MPLSERAWDLVKLIIDKLIIGLMVAGIGLIGLWKVNSSIEAAKNAQAEKLDQYRQEQSRNLEDLKLKEARERFWQEKRLAALTDIGAACSDMSEVFFDNAGKKEVTETVGREYDHRINRARAAINRHIVLLKPDFDRRMSLYIQLHRSFRDVGLSQCEPYRVMAGSVERALDKVVQASLEDKPLPLLPLEPIPHKEREKLSAADYLARQQKYWQAHKAADE